MQSSKRAQSDSRGAGVLPATMPGARCQVSGVRCQMPGVRCQVSGARCQMPDIICQVPGARCQVPGADARCLLRCPRGTSAGCPGAGMIKMASCIKVQKNALFRIFRNVRIQTLFRAFTSKLSEIKAVKLSLKSSWGRFNKSLADNNCNCLPFQ